MPPPATVKRKPEKKVDNKSLHYNTLYTIPESAANSIINAYAIPFAIALKASAIEIGLLSSARNIASTLAQVPGAMLTQYMGRKNIWILSMLVARLLWLPIVLMAFFGTISVAMFIILISVYSFFLALNSPAWASMMGDMVPDKIRGKYFGKRNMVAGFSGMVATFAAGIMLAYGFAPLFALSFILGIVAIAVFLPIREPPTKFVYHYKHSIAIKPGEIREAIALNKNLAIFTIFISMMYFAVNVAGPFFVVYMLDDLAIGYIWFGIIVAFGAFVTVIFQPYWGGLVDRFGERKIIFINGVLVCFIPLFYIFATSPWHLLVIEFFSSFAWAGFELAAFNFLLDIVPAEKRPVYIANHTFLKGVAIVAGTLLGAFIVNGLGNGSFLFMHGIQVIFFLSFVLRLASLLLLPKIRDADVKQSLVPVRYVFWRAVAVEPIRGVTSAIDYTFHYPYKLRSIRKSVDDRKRQLDAKIKMAG